MDVIQLSFAFKGSVCSDLCVIRNFVQDVLEKLNKVINDETVMFDVRLILNELMANGVIHGNNFDKDKCIKLSVEVIGDLVRIEVTDEGQGFECDLKSYDPLELKCCGRGLILVNGLSDELYVDKNRIVAVKYL